MSAGDRGRHGAGRSPARPRRTPGSEAEARLLEAAAEGATLERRHETRSITLGPRAERTRRRLIESAWKLFREKGYLQTAVSEIAEDAGVSMATFYQYFSDRSDLVRALVVEVVREMLDRGVNRWDPRTGRMGLRRLIEQYVDSYVDHREFFELWQTVTHVDERLRSLYRDYHVAYQHRFGELLEEGVEQGLVRADLDPVQMATAMTLMIERYCYEVYVFNPPADGLPSVGAVTDLVTSLWADAIGLVESTERPRRPRQLGDGRPATS
jgi:AcrR family transcriptional regulator